MSSFLFSSRSVIMTRASGFWDILELVNRYHREYYHRCTFGPPSPGIFVNEMYEPQLVADDLFWFCSLDDIIIRG